MNRTMRLIFANYEIVIGPSVLIVGGMTLRQMRQAGSAKHMAIMFAFNLIRYRRALGLLSFYDGPCRAYLKVACCRGLGDRRHVIGSR